MAENTGVGHCAPLHTVQAVPCTDDGNGKVRGERLYRRGGLTLGRHHAPTEPLSHSLSSTGWQKKT